MTLYAIYDADGVSDAPIYGIFTSMDKANEACDSIVKRMAEESLAEDQKESGITADDYDWLIKDCRSSLAIQIVDNIDYIYY